MFRRHALFACVGACFFLCGASPSSGGVIVDSAMTREEALAGVDPLCPAEIVRRQAVVDVEYYSHDGLLHRGQIVIDESLAGDVRALFAAMRAAKFPVTSAIPVADRRFNWDDGRSMAADNTSAFNYRRKTGGAGLSAHAYGRAIDVNPLRNPCVFFRGDMRLMSVLPAGARLEPSRPGTLTAGGAVVRAARALGWTWGGQWKSPRDYQHFEKGPFVLQ